MRLVSHTYLLCLHRYVIGYEIYIRPVNDISLYAWCTCLLQMIVRCCDVFVHVCFVQVTILKLVWRSRVADTPRCATFPTDICSVIQEGVLTVEKCAHQGASARRERQTL